MTNRCHRMHVCATILIAHAEEEDPGNICKVPHLTTEFSPYLYKREASQTQSEQSAGLKLLMLFLGSFGAIHSWVETLLQC
jgi:hypothetical protein